MQHLHTPTGYLDISLRFLTCSTTLIRPILRTFGVNDNMQSTICKINDYEAKIKSHMAKINDTNKLDTTQHILHGHYNDTERAKRRPIEIKQN